MEKTDKLPYGGNGLCNVIEAVFGRESREYALLKMIAPDYYERYAMADKLCIIYWASEVQAGTSIQNCDKATKLRKTIIALMIAVADQSGIEHWTEEASLLVDKANK